jgi:hypothetical protein
MRIIRKIPIWIVLASYLFANTLASSWHDHGHCSDHCQNDQHRGADCAAIEHDSRAGEHCCHHDTGHHHTHSGAHSHDACQNHESGRDQPTGQPPSQPTGQKHDGDGQHCPQHCVVCDFLAIAPLAAPLATLTADGEILPELVVLRVLPVSGTTVETHLARGPPAA